VRVIADEIPVTFPCDGDTLVGVLHLPSSPRSLGVVIVVGGPQYRVGSHRQFVMLARDLSARGIAVLRFDCRGMGDSEGEFHGFERIEPDIAAAVDAIMRRVSTLHHVALWGLCDATLAMTERARRDKRIAGVALLNPWVRSESGLARTQLKHYYLARLRQPDFLRKVLTGKFNPITAARGLLGNIVRALGRPTSRSVMSKQASPNSLAERMAQDLQRFDGSVLVILSGRDLTAREFAAAARGSVSWQQLFAEKRLTRRELAVADHTFSRRLWRDQVADWTWDWITRLGTPP
jgi:exosortase A-associated hydrolase 1